MSKAEPHHIIAIGASAGGMEEINSFFDHTPLDQVSYVVIQHLSADYKSRMVQLLARHSKLVVAEAENEMEVKSNQVYLIPNDKYMTIRDNKLYLTDKSKDRTAHHTINVFFNSLAADYGKKAIGVILSGMGNDGTEGVKAIKREGGMVIARAPETSAFSSMPAHAIETGLVDFVLEPEAMPNAIEDYVKYGAEISYNSKDDEKNIQAIINLIKEKSPFDFSEYKQTTILRRTKRRAAYNHINSLGNYLELLKKNPDEVVALGKEFLISVTSFFRDEGAFEFIQKTIFPQILKKLGPGEELKMWIAGCATGEEVYSIAILIAELLTGDYKNTVVKIFATDIDSDALLIAGKGVYNERIAKQVSAIRLEKHFTKTGDTYKIKPVVRAMVIFAKHDLVKNPPYCNMHFISCRNLLIYMTPVLQKKIFMMLLFGLKMDGYLFLGSSETPAPIIENLKVASKKWKIYQNQEEKRTFSFDAFSFPEIIDRKFQKSSLYNVEPAKYINSALAEAMHERLASELDYLVVCVDEKNHVIKSYGDTTKFLLPHPFNFNLTELMPRPLVMAFKTLSKSALKTNESLTLNHIKVERAGVMIKVNLSVSPVLIKKGEQLLMVTLTEDKPLTHPKKEHNDFNETIHLDQYTLNLEEELGDLREKLQTTVEQLDASNENLQSFNEELISANEEMQSTNEEMQSVNEELDTINSDYQLKNKELLEINDDLNNYFRSNINGQLFIDNNLLLKKFSPGTVKLINLLETDIGRPLSNISTNIKLETIIEDAKKVLAEGNIITKEIETNNDTWYQVMTMPYIRQANNKRSGAIITFNDITALKNAQLELDQKNASLMRINGDLDNFVHTASHDLLGPLGNIEGSIALMNNIDAADPDMGKFLSIINTSVKKFRSLIKDIATVAKIEDGNIATEQVNIDDLINNIEWSLNNKISAAGAVINRELEVKEIYFSKKNLRSILYNLISNGIKFKRPEDSVINISTKKEAGIVSLCVEDNGIGIPKAGLHKIFDLHGRLNQKVEGQGLGLYLVKKIINAAEGNITVDSTPGTGSKFTIHFKAVKA